jgi:CheY-like chemotaxis protein
MNPNDLKPVILFAEDDDAIRQMTVFLLADLGAQIHAVPSGYSAREVLETHPVDLIITDMAMADGDGLWLINWVRASVRHQRTRMVVVSAHAAPHTIAAAKKAGADDYLLKPFIPSQFRATIARHLQTALAAQGTLPQPRES